jgi:hypothetical protein
MPSELQSYVVHWYSEKKKELRWSFQEVFNLAHDCHDTLIENHIAS